MYNDNELYEINIDKLAYSLEHGIDINAREYIYSSEAKIKREDWEEKKGEVKKALEKLYDAVHDKSFKSVKSLMKRYEKNITEAKIKKAVSFVEKTKFVKNLMKHIEESDKVRRGDKECMILSIDKRVLNEIFKEAKQTITHTSSSSYNFGENGGGYTIGSSRGVVEEVNYAVDAVINTFKGGFLSTLFLEKKYKNSYFKVRWGYINERYYELAIIPKFKIKD